MKVQIYLSGQIFSSPDSTSVLKVKVKLIHIVRCLLLDSHWGDGKDLVCNWALVCSWITQGKTKLWTTLHLLLITGKVILQTYGIVIFFRFHFYLVFCAICFLLETNKFKNLNRLFWSPQLSWVWLSWS